MADTAETARGRLVVIAPDGKTTSAPLDAAPSLDALQEAVGGYIEVVPLFNSYEGGPCVAFCNEEGKLDRLDYNPYATAAWRRALGFDPRARGDYLVGSIAIVCGPEELLREL